MLVHWLVRAENVSCLVGLQPHLWHRFIDDIWFLWRGTEEELTQFVNYLNSYHPTIKFKCKKDVNFSFSTGRVDFLDTTVWIDADGFIQTTLYSKPSRVVQYLLPSSSHPSHITRNIPYSLGYDRFCSIGHCSNSKRTCGMEIKV